MTDTPTQPISRFHLLAHQVRRGEFLWIKNAEGVEVHSKILLITPETDEEGRVLVRFVCHAGTLVVGADETVAVF